VGPYLVAELLLAPRLVLASAQLAADAPKLELEPTYILNMAN
jgi:hypothetical protein